MGHPVIVGFFLALNDGVKILNSNLLSVCMLVWIKQLMVHDSLKGRGQQK